MGTDPGVWYPVDVSGGVWRRSYAKEVNLLGYQ